MNKQTIITILLALVAMTGQAQTPKDSCSIPKVPKIALPKNDIYREKFMNLQLINIIGSHLSR